MKLRKYYSSFRSLSGIFAGLIAALPFISQFLPGTGYAFPPLGDAEAPARVGLVLLAFAVTFAVYFLASDISRNTGRVIAIAIAVSVVGLFVYFALFEGFVRGIDIPSRNTTVYVTVGYERTPFAMTTFDSAPDEVMLRSRGTDEEQLRTLWTLKSLIIVRLALFASYCTIVLALVAAFSCGVVNEASQKSS